MDPKPFHHHAPENSPEANPFATPPAVFTRLTKGGIVCVVLLLLAFFAERSTQPPPNPGPKGPVRLISKEGQEDLNANIILSKAALANGQWQEASDLFDKVIPIAEDLYERQSDPERKSLILALLLQNLSDKALALIMLHQDAQPCYKRIAELVAQERAAR